MFIFRPDDPPSAIDLRLAADRLRSLADDLESYGVGAFPSATELSEAPVLDGYIPTLSLRPVLLGLVTGHPIKPGSNRGITTSTVWAIDEGRRWARTENRLYRLGSRGGESSGVELPQ